jgi:hypothetical protein
MVFVISINVHENAPFLIKQLKNISNHVSNFVVILNCNQYMFKIVSKLNLRNVVINPKIIEKSLYHGSLLHGIYSNLLYAQKYKYSYFIVLSSRNMFYQMLTKEGMDNYPKINHYNDCEKDVWRWPSFKQTLLSKQYECKNLHGSAHEGLVFDYDTCIKIIQFLENHKDVKEDLIQFHDCVEEFALQTIAVHEGNGFMNIGCGVDTHFNMPTDPTKYVFKTLRI